MEELPSLEDRDLGGRQVRHTCKEAPSGPASRYPGAEPRYGAGSRASAARRHRLRDIRRDMVDDHDPALLFDRVGDLARLIVAGTILDCVLHETGRLQVGVTEGLQAGRSPTP